MAEPVNNRLRSLPGRAAAAAGEPRILNPAAPAPAQRGKKKRLCKKCGQYHAPPTGQKCTHVPPPPPPAVEEIAPVRDAGR